jgi:hypothetical protein
MTGFLWCLTVLALVFLGGMIRVCVRLHKKLKRLWSIHRIERNKINSLESQNRSYRRILSGNEITLGDEELEELEELLDCPVVGLDGGTVSWRSSQDPAVTRRLDPRHGRRGPTHR